MPIDGVTLSDRCGPGRMGGLRTALHSVSWTGVLLLTDITGTERTGRFHGAWHLMEDFPGNRRDIRANGRRIRVLLPCQRLHALTDHCYLAGGGRVTEKSDHRCART